MTTPGTGAIRTWITTGNTIMRITIPLIRKTRPSSFRAHRFVIVCSCSCGSSIPNCWRHSHETDQTGRGRIEPGKECGRAVVLPHGLRDQVRPGPAGLHRPEVFAGDVASGAVVL